MDADFSPEQEQLRDSVRRFLAEHASLAFTRECWNLPRGTTETVWKGMAELGLVGLLAPESCGGSGGSFCDIGVVLHEMGRVAHSGPFLSSAVGAVSAALALDASDLLPGLADGTRVGALALGEPGARFGAWMHPATRADGDRLTGEKAFVPDAAGADVLFVTAGSAVYLVESGAEGLDVEAAETLDGTRRFAHVRLDSTPARELGPIGALAPAVDRLLVGFAADGLGAAEAALEISVAHARQRVQFGRPIGAFQAVAHLCADMLQAVELGRAGVHYALWAADHAEPEERHRAALLTRAWAAEAFPKVGANTIQVFGGAGYSWEFDAHLFYKRLLSVQQHLGTSEDCLEALASLLP